MNEIEILASKAEDAGYEACKDDLPRVAALNGDVQDLLAGMKVGDGAAAIMEGFYKGYQKAADEDADAILGR
jgi:hypothetical protein